MSAENQIKKPRRRGRRPGQRQKPQAKVSFAELAGRLSGSRLPQPKVRARDLFAPAKTLGFKFAEKNGLTMDSALESSGCYDILDDYIELLGVDGARGITFVGYPQLSLLEQNPLIRTVVGTLANETVRRWNRLKNSDSDMADTVRDIEDTLEHYKVRSHFKKAAETTGYQGGCMLFIDLGKRGEELENPLTLSPETVSKGSFKGFRKIEPINVFPAPYNANSPLEEGYFEPMHYYVFGQKVHKSWFLKFTTGDLGIMLRPAYNFFGISLAQLMLRYVGNFERSRDASADTVENFSLLGLKTDMNQMLEGGSADDVIHRLLAMLGAKRNYGVAVMNKDTEEFFQINTPLSGLEGLVAQQLELFALISGEPVTKLFGTPPRGMDATGDTDISNHNDRIRNWQEQLYFDNFEKARKVIELSEFGQYYPDIETEWLPVKELTDKEKVEIEKTKADRDLALVQTGGIDGQDVRSRISQDESSDYYDIDPNDLPEPDDSNFEILEM